MATRGPGLGGVVNHLRQVHLRGQDLGEVADLDRRLPRVPGEDPELDPDPLEVGDHIQDPVLEPVIYGYGGGANNVLALHDLVRHGDQLIVPIPDQRQCHLELREPLICVLLREDPDVEDQILQPFRTEFCEMINSSRASKNDGENNTEMRVNRCCKRNTPYRPSVPAC